MNTVVKLKRLKVPTARQFTAMRDDLEFSQKQMARFLQISPRALQYYEAGHRPVPEWLAYRLIRLGAWKEN